MPYIHPEDRELLKNDIVAIGPGELNYQIMAALLDYIHTNYNYAKLNEVIGVLEVVKQEFYRRVVVPYEEKKIKENGDLPYPHA